MNTCKHSEQLTFSVIITIVTVLIKFASECDKTLEKGKLQAWTHINIDVTHLVCVNMPTPPKKKKKKKKKEMSIHWQK